MKEEVTLGLVKRLGTSTLQYYFDGHDGDTYRMTVPAAEAIPPDFGAVYVIEVKEASDGS